MDSQTAMEYPSHSPVIFRGDNIRVSEPDEEVFLLYVGLNGNNQSTNSTGGRMHGLGFVDTTSDSLTISIPVPANTSADTSPKRSARSRRRRKVPISESSRSKEREIELHQQTTALRSRVGDTGSVLWSASLELLRLIAEPSVFDLSRLANCHVLELGAGTGFLAVGFSPLVRRYTATDLPELLSLIQKNVSLNELHPSSNVVVQPCDWVQLSSMQPSSRSRCFTLDEPADVLLVVDCVYNPSLIDALTTTISHFANSRTTVLVFIELRSDEVVFSFLASWIKSGSWNIWRVVHESIPSRYAFWVGWKIE